MSHGCFISYKKEDRKLGYLKMVHDKLTEKGIVHSFLDEPIDSDNLDTVIGILRKNYMNNKPVTLFLIGEYSYEDSIERWNNNHSYFESHPYYNEQSYIIRELRATLSDYDGSPRHGIVGIVLPTMYDKIFKGTYRCQHCGQKINYVDVNDKTVIREFWQNYYLIPENDNCDHYSDDGRYCILCTLDDFLGDPENYINQAYDKSISPLAKHVHYKNIDHDYFWKSR